MHKTQRNRFLTHKQLSFVEYWPCEKTCYMRKPFICNQKRILYRYEQFSCRSFWLLSHPCLLGRIIISLNRNQILSYIKYNETEPKILFVNILNVNKKQQSWINLKKIATSKILKYLQFFDAMDELYTYRYHDHEYFRSTLQMKLDYPQVSTYLNSPSGVSSTCTLGI